jgi:hypothetical protein
MPNRTVLFVCQHGAGKSRIAAAWFNQAPPAGWAATTAGVQPQAQVSVRAPRLLAGSSAEPALDDAPPRPLSAVPDPAIVVAIDCAVPGAVRWNLDNREFSAAMCAEIRHRVRELTSSMPQPATGTPR